jgi:LacI family transcriptional regulator
MKGSPTVKDQERVDSRRPVTRQDVARYAGVSTAVVSYVVNSGPKAVAPATRAKVLDAIRLLDYRPNAAARALKLGSTQLLGLVVPDSTNPYFAELSRAIEEAADAKGLAVLLTNSAGAALQEGRLLQKLISRQIDGLLLASVGAVPDLSRVAAANIPVVLLDRDEGVSGLVAVGTDYRAGSQAGVRHLIEHGHTDIGLVVGRDTGGTIAAREAGWLGALAEAGLAEGPIAHVGFSREGGYEAGKRLLNRERPPTAIFASSDMQAIGVLRAIHESDWTVPDDIAVISFDGSIESEFRWPPLTTIRQPVHEMARAAIDALTRDRSDFRDEYLSYPTELIIRASCGCHPVNR